MKAEAERRGWIPGTTAERALLLLLILLAFALRALPGMGYAHDELSALIRLYPSLGDTITKGVVGVDTHPPGVQVFLWAWTHLVGLEERWVKLPFVLASVAALVPLYRVASRSASTSVALLSTALLACIQYTVLYGQLARPYAFGLFTTACMTDALLSYRDTGRRGALVVLALCAALSGWIHHIALLQAILIALTGLVLVRREQRAAYLVACGASVVLYLPNVPLLLRQFAWKGLDEWLAPPTWRWPLVHAGFVAHWSIAFGVLLGTMATWALLRGLRGKRFTRDLVLVGLLCGLLPYLIVFAYSAWRAPVLQHSVMLFAFPYALLLALAGLRDLPFGRTAVVALVMAATAVVTLVTTRRHYALNAHAHNRYEAIARGVIAANEAGIPALTDAPAHVLRFTFDRWRTPTALRRCTDLTGLDARSVDALLAGLGAEQVFLGVTLQAPEERPLQVRRYFPFLLERHDMAEGQTFLFGARPTATAIDDAWSTSTITPQAIHGPGWTLDKAVPLVADTGSTYASLPCWDFSAREYGLSFAARLDSLAPEGHPVIEARAEVIGRGPMDGARLVLEVVEGKTSKGYHTSAPMWSARGTLAVAAGSDLVERPAHAFVQAYIWNEHGAPLRIASVQVVARRGNPVRYAWLGPVEAAWTYR